MRRQYCQNDSEISLNLTPLIDMVFILLVFFVVNSSFIKETGVEIERPQAKTSESQESGNILIGVTANGEIWLDKQVVDIRSLRGHLTRLHAEAPQGSAVVLADTKAEAGIVMEVIDQARLAGIEKVAVAAEKP